MNTIQPFKTVEQGKAWQNANCRKCRYAHLGNSHSSIEDLERQIQEGTECPLKMAVTLAFTGNLPIPSSQAKEIGYTSAYGFATRCKKQRSREKSQGATGNNPRKITPTHIPSPQISLF